MRPLLIAAALLALAPPAARAQAPLAVCVDGMAAGYACEGVDLLAVVTPQELGAPASGTCPAPYRQLCMNDVWGWTDPDTGRRVVVVGLPNGAAFVDVTVPTAPLRLGMLPTATDPSSWRDVKVLGNVALVVSEAAAHGLQIFDLTRLRGLADNPARRFTADAVYPGIGPAHNVVVNEATGFAYAVGARGGEGSLPATCDARGLHAIDLADPMSPQFAGCFTDQPNSRRGYTHDAQCVVYDGPDADYTGRELCLAANEDIVSVFDVTDKAAGVLVSQVDYPNDAYTHQAWLTEDHRYLLVNDELDEHNGLVPTQRTMVVDLTDLDEPEFAFIYDSGLPVIDHNLYVHGGLAFESNYEAGLRVLDLSEIASGTLEEIAYFDTYPQGQAVGFAGQWSNYPFFGDGLVVASDAANGLFVLRLQDGLAVAAEGTPGAPGGYALSAPHPNPTADGARLALRVDAAQQVRAELLDATGRRLGVVFEGTAGPGAPVELAISTTELPTGFYVVRVTGEAFAASRRLVVSR